jgi:hypothetical protein
MVPATHGTGKVGAAGADGEEGAGETEVEPTEEGAGMGARMQDKKGELSKGRNCFGLAV